MIDEPQDEPQVEKTVTIIGYLADDPGDKRDAAAQIDPHSDYTERERRESRSVEIVYDDPDTDREQTQSVFSADMADALAQTGLEDPFSVNVERDVNNDYVRATFEAGNSVRKRLVRDTLPHEIGDLERSFHRKYQTENRITKIQIDVEGPEESRVLKHHDTRTAENRFEDETSRMALTFSVTMGPADESDVEHWSKQVVDPLAKALAREEWTGRVRIADCKETVEKQGDCFDF